jgi:hypothetical protein
MGLTLYRLLAVGIPLVVVSVLHFLSSQFVGTPEAGSSTQLLRAAIKPQRYWCMLTRDLVPRDNKWFMTIEHFPHTLEWYADCWNWVQEQSGDAGEDALGGFIIDDAVNKKLQRKYWNRAFFPAMKWPVQILNNQTKTTIPYDRLTTKTYPGSGWFQREGMCDSFRNRMWKNLGVTPRESSKKYQRIGIVNRNESRAIIEIDMLVGKLQKKYPKAQVEVRAFDSEYQLQSEADSMETQAKWFADKDLIIMAHGAAMSNVVFMRPGASLFELYPRFYFNDMFWDLMNQCGVNHGWFYDQGNSTKQLAKGEYDELKARAETEKYWDDRFYNKRRNIGFKWSQVDHHIKALIEAVDA